MSTTWIESAGGPLVIIPESLLLAWRGVAGSSSGLIGDYERACAVEEEVGIISCRDRAVLVLGDEPLRTTWIADRDGGILVRWVYADSEEEALAAVTAANVSAVVTDSEISFEVDGPVRLIDAADPGDSLESGSLLLNLSQGFYRVDSGLLDAGPKTRLVVHRLTRAA